MVSDTKSLPQNKPLVGRDSISLSLCKKGELERVKNLQDYDYQPKLDGIRVLSYYGKLINRDSGTNQLNREINKQFPEINPPENLILDGEIIGENFNDISGRIHLEDEFKIELRSEDNPATYVVFDLLAIAGNDIRSKAQEERWINLDMYGDKVGENIKICPTLDNGEKLWEKVIEHDREGIVAKDRTAPYRGKRTNDWIKVKNWNEEVFKVKKWEKTENGGFVIHIEPTEGENQRVVVNGEKDQERIKKLENVEVEVQYLSVTDSGVLRKPSFKGVV